MAKHDNLLYAKAGAMAGIIYFLVALGLFFLGCFLVQVFYNNSIVKMSKDENGKERLEKMDYSSAIFLTLLIGLLFPTVYIITSNAC